MTRPATPNPDTSALLRLGSGVIQTKMCVISVRSTSLASDRYQQISHHSRRPREQTRSELGFRTRSMKSFGLGVFLQVTERDQISRNVLTCCLKLRTYSIPYARSLRSRLSSCPFASLNVCCMGSCWVWFDGPDNELRNLEAECPTCSFFDLADAYRHR